MWIQTKDQKPEINRHVVFAKGDQMEDGTWGEAWHLGYYVGDDTWIGNNAQAVKSPERWHPIGDEPKGGLMDLKFELIRYLDSIPITSENIGNIRRSCFVPWDSQWNALVRDETAAREK